MHRAIIHIGTEKTGSTSIQNFLFKNEKALAANQFFFPFKSCGLISNYRLVLFALNKPDRGLCSIDKKSTLSALPDAPDEHFDAWKTEFKSEHEQHIKALRKGLKSSTIVYSSEHFHSRTREPEELTKLKSLLDELYDEVQIVVYLRRQDRLAISSRNTAIQGGNTQLFSFDSIPGVPPYFDYSALVNRWADVFGTKSTFPRNFDPSSMYKGDVVEDFSHEFLGLKANEIIKTKVPESKLSALKKKVLNASSQVNKPTGNSTTTNNNNNTGNIKTNSKQQSANTRLCYSALCTLVDFNKLDENSELLQGNPKASLRQSLIRELHNLNDDYGELLPARESAQAFYDRFRDSNNALSKRWESLDEFSDNFDMYPDDAHEYPEIDSQTILAEALSTVIVKSA